MQIENEKCENNMEQYLSLDKNERVPFKISMHLISCKKCRTQIKMLKTAEKVCKHSIIIATPINDSTIENIMQKVSPETYKTLSQKNSSLHKWIIGSLIIPVMMFIPAIFTTSAMNIDLLSLFYALLLAIYIASYCCVFALGNVDLFVKKISAKVKL